RERSVREPRHLHLPRDGTSAVAERKRGTLAAARLLRDRLPNPGGALLGDPGSRDRMGLDERGKFADLRGRTGQRSFADRMGWTVDVPVRRRSDHDGRAVVSTTICLAPARTIAYPQGGGHLWVYLQWALGLRRHGPGPAAGVDDAGRRPRGVASHLLHDRRDRRGAGRALPRLRHTLAPHPAARVLA